MIAAEHIEAAKVAWQKARLYDDRLGDVDKNRLGVWAEALASLDAHPDEAHDAVTRWYTAAGGRERVIQIGDILAEIRTRRRQLAEADHTANVIGHAVEDPQLSGLGINADGDPVWTAYEQHGAIKIPCDCGAAPDDACVNTANGAVRKIPCTSRLIEARRQNEQR
ncbi:hypothetical protein SEA_LILBEANIE_58 [Gordonia phage Lilbeanie]|uniref:Uncharacterized protein n=1 Tax=Gordonia phage Lilbeanie TaxID=2794947 RepID=A0A7T1NWA4_9CAUD|nr:hypothetical protein J1773_gp58 [Gordonia phage Lilbeanie]QPO17136.1 hypothetical protein SEA_LILBEANIE_58 [Gordonia phage Lilbeanie]